MTQQGTREAIRAPELSIRLCGADSAADVWADETLSTSRNMLHREVARCEHLLTAKGAGPGDVVAIQMQPCTTLIAAVLAIWRLDARVMILDHRLTPTETKRLTTLCPPGFMLRSAAGVAHFASECDVEIERYADQAQVPDSVCLVQFTSGSTGQSKVVTRSAQSLHDEIERFAAIEHMPGPADRILLLCSPIHTWGLMGGILYGLAQDVPLAFAAGAHPGAVVRAVQSLGVTAIFGVPTHFEMLASMAEVPPLPSLRSATSAGALTSQKVADLCHQRLGCRLGQVYGLTEAGVVTADIAGLHRPPAVGTAAPGMVLRVTHGELSIAMERSPYLVQDGVDRFADGWLRTFDRAEIDPATGVVSIFGRADSVVSIAGMKIDLMEIEEIVQEHPAVTHVIATFDEIIEAYVAASTGLTAQDLTQWCRGRLSPVKIPKRFFVADRLPLTPSGKVIRDRGQLRKEFDGC